jgi:two-component system, NarL family, sensor kinase
MKIGSTIICCMMVLCLFYACRHDNQGNLNNTDKTTKIYLDSIQKMALLSDSIRHSDKKAAKETAYRALGLARKINSPEALSVAYQMMGMVSSKEQADSGFYYYSKAMKISDSCGYSEVRIRARYNLALLYQRSFNFKPAIILLDSMIYIAKQENDFAGISDAYNSIGTIQNQLHDSVSAREMFFKARELAKEHKLYRQEGLSLANLASFEINREKAAETHRLALVLLKKGGGSAIEIASVMINLGGLQSNPDSALFYLKSALKIAEGGNLPELQFIANNSMAYSYLDKGDAVSAEKCLTEHAIPLAKKIRDYNGLTAVYDTYADVLAYEMNYKAALENEKNALNAKNQEVSGKAMEQVKLLIAMLDLKNKEAIISSNENDLLKQSNHIRQMKLMLIICLLIISASVLFILWMRQNTRVKLQLEQIRSAKKIIEIEEMEKARLARDLHDTVGQLVQGLNAHITSIKLPDDKLNQDISLKLNDLHQNIRRFTHQMGHVATDKFSFNQLITGLCEDVRSLTGLRLQYNIPDFHFAFPEELILHIYRIVQELLTNANKYCGSASVNIQFALVENTLLLYYKDEGPGFDPGKAIPDTMGLINITTRVKLMGGTSTLKTSLGNGTKWEINIPLKNVSGQKNYEA